MAHKKLPHKTLHVHSVRYAQCIHVSSDKLNTTNGLPKKLPKNANGPDPPTPSQKCSYRQQLNVEIYTESQIMITEKRINRTRTHARAHIHVSASDKEKGNGRLGITCLSYRRQSEQSLSQEPTSPLIPTPPFPHPSPPHKNEHLHLGLVEGGWVGCSTWTRPLGDGSRTTSGFGEANLTIISSCSTNSQCTWHSLNTTVQSMHPTLTQTQQTANVPDTHITQQSMHPTLTQTQQTANVPDSHLTQQSMHPTLTQTQHNKQSMHLTLTQTQQSTHLTLT